MTGRTTAVSRFRPFAVALAVSLTVVAAACTKHTAAKTAQPTTASKPTTTTTSGPSGPPDPLTGLPTESAAIASRPAVVVKVENAPEARPQSGMDKADLVVEERVEGSVVRFLTVFHSQDAPLVGPIRSIRPTDPAVVSPIGGVFVFSGGNPAFIARLKGVPVTPIQESGHGESFIIPNGKRRPHATFASTSILRDLAGTKAKAPPQKLFDFLPKGAAFEPAGSAPQPFITVIFGSLTKATWTWDPAREAWMRTTNGTPHVMEDGTQLSAVNVIVQYIAYKRTSFTDVTGFRVDEGVVVGSGRALILSGGRMIEARWSKPSIASVTDYTDAQGAPIALMPGNTWVMLPAIGAQTITTTPTTTTSSTRPGVTTTG